MKEYKILSFSFNSQIKYFCTRLFGVLNFSFSWTATYSGFFIIFIIIYYRIIKIVLVTKILFNATIMKDIV